MFKQALNRLWAIMSKGYLECSQQSMVERFFDKVNNFQSLTIFTKSSIIYIRQPPSVYGGALLQKYLMNCYFRKKSYIINVRRGSKYILDSGSGFIIYGKHKTLLPLFIDGVQLSKGYRATARIQFTFYYPVPRSSWYLFN